MPRGKKHSERFSAVDPQLVIAPTEAAVAAIGSLESGCRLIGMTKGQFSLLDLIKAVLIQTGPADLTLSTWTAGIRDTENVDMLKTKGQIRNLTLLLDRSFRTRQPQYVEAVERVFGRDAIRCVRTHAKFCMIRNEQWDICIRSSMNLNRNTRFEQFDLDDSAEICDFFQGHVDEMTELLQPGFDFDESQVERVMSTSMNDGKPTERPQDTHSNRVFF